MHVMLEVFLIPVGGGKYQPYCEPLESDPGLDGEERAGLWRRLVARFKATLADAEMERRRAARGQPRPAADTLLGRARDRVLRHVAEHVAEKRLLWHLRKETSAVLHYPDCLTAERAREIVHAEMRRDTDRHLIWLVIYTILFVASGALALVPGPNVIAYFLGFFVVAHYLSWRGARHGLSRVTWQPESSVALADLERALLLTADERATSIREIAARLRLEDLPIFVERMAPSRA